MRSISHLLPSLAATLLLSFAFSSADAATIAYWRFEDGALLNDSSGNGHNLTNNSGNMSAYALPGTGPGSDFLNPIPSTGASNEQAVQRNRNGGYYLDVPTDTSFFSDTITLELMVNAASRSGNGFLAGVWGGGGDTTSTSSYALYMASGGSLQLVLKHLGNSATVFVDPGFTLALNTDYYVGVSFELTADSEPLGDTATFYLQNLTAGTALVSETVSFTMNGSVQQSLTNNFTIGASKGGQNGENWGGYVDEIRLSNTALSQSQLLAVPEPSTALLAGIGVLGLAALRRRRCCVGV